MSGAIFNLFTLSGWQFSVFKLWDHCYTLDLLYSVVYACWKCFLELCLTKLKETHKDRPHKFLFPNRNISVSGWMNILFQLSISLRELEGKAVHLESQKTLVREKKEDCGCLSEIMQDSLMAAEKNLLSWVTVIFFFFGRKNSEIRNKKVRELNMFILWSHLIVLHLTIHLFERVGRYLFFQINFFRALRPNEFSFFLFLSFKNKSRGKVWKVNGNAYNRE